jgi:hypothetical protein
MDLEERRAVLHAACELAVLNDRTGRAVRRAVDAADRGDTETALNLASAVALSEPGCADAAVILACLLEQQRPGGEMAVRHIRSAVAQDPSNSMALWYAARHEMRAGNAGVGLAMLQDAAACQPVDSYAVITLAWYLGMFGRAAEALRILQRLIAGDRPLLCKAMMNILVQTVAPSLSRNPDGDGPTPNKCLPELTRLADRDNPRDCYEGLFGAAYAAPAGADPEPGTQPSHLCCQHLANPAASIYTARYGQRVVSGYGHLFFREILGPEVRSALRTPRGREDGVLLPPEMLLVPEGIYNVTATGVKGGGTHKVPVTAFLLDKYPVTNQQWRQFLPSHVFSKGQENHPVVNVDYLQAVLYARWQGKRLPTEAEWEAAAAGPGGRVYPWGNEADPERANCGERKIKGTTPVTQFPRGAAACGTMDMVGNSQEWVSDVLPAENQPVASRVVKGGNWILPIARLTCRWRAAMPCLTKHPLVGFRCAKDL